ECLDARRDLVEHVDRLPAGIALADDLAGAVGGGRAADQDAVAGAHGAAVAAKRLPYAAAVEAQAPRLARHGLGGKHLRQARQMLAEVAGGGEERRAAVFAAAVAG